MDNFYSRCLLCTCRPDVTPHLHIFSDVGKQLQLADKIKHLNIQIEAELPQNVCHSCMQKLEVTHELVMSSQQARIMLLQIRQHEEKINQVISESLMKDLNSTHAPAIEDRNCMGTNLVPVPEADSTWSVEDRQRSNNDFAVSEESTNISLMHFSSKPEILRMLEVKQCSFCSAQMYSKVLELHLMLHHQSYQEPAELNPMLKCPVCQCTLSSQLMQQHILQQHPPIPNPQLQQDCHYCHLKFSHCDLPQHLDSQHGLNAWTECVHCKKMIRNTHMDLETHLFQDHAGGQLLVCLTCDILYSLTGQEQAHMHTHLNFKCPLHSCSQMFDSFASLREHVFTLHPQFEQEMQAELEKETYDILRTISVETNDTRPSDIQTLDNGGPVNCDICNETVKHKYSLIEHKNKAHNLNLMFECEECGNRYPIFKKLNDHIRGKHFSKNYECTVCGELFTKKSYPLHLRWHRRFPYGIQASKSFGLPHCSVFCGICQKLVRNRRALLVHINSKHLDVVGDPLPLFCEVYDEEFDKFKTWMHNRCGEMIKFHEQSNTNSSLLLCSICNECVKNKYHLVKHINSKHIDVIGEPQPFCCDKCDKQFSHYQYLMHHLNTHNKFGRKWRNIPHTLMSPVYCGICNCKAKNKFCLLTHINSKHLDVVMEPLPFCCELCDRQFTAHKNWLHHQRNMHLPKVKCNTCGKTINQHYMPIHLEIHKKNRDREAEMVKQTNVSDTIPINTEVLAQHFASTHDSIGKTDNPTSVNTEVLAQFLELHGESSRKRRYISDKPLQRVHCGICNYYALHKFCLVKHINTKHLDVVGQPLPFCCELCDKQFTNYKYLMSHRTKVHLPKLNCEQCGKLISRYKMQGHLKTHERKSIGAERRNTSMDAFEEMLIPEIEIVEHPIKLEPVEKENDDFITELQESQNSGMEKIIVPMNGIGVMATEIEIVEHPIKLEEEQMDCLIKLQNDDVKAPLENQLPECQVLLHNLLVCELCCFYTENSAEFSTHLLAHLHKYPPA